MNVEVIVPFGTHDDEHRRAARRWVLARYAALHPRWTLTPAEHTGPWIKAMAVNPAADASDADVLVIADADSFVTADALTTAVAAAYRGTWAQPAAHVRRLDRDATAITLAADPTGLPTVTAGRSHQLLAGGGIVVVRRDVWADVDGYDPRFLGWGGEDYALGCALRAVTGRYAHKTPGTLWHLWHPPAPSYNGMLPPGNSALASRYRAAKFDPAEARAIINERRESWR